MHTTPPLRGRDLATYHDYLQSDHDYEIWADVLNMEETKVVASVDILDGQINFDTESDGPDRTASLVLSDPDGALSFGASFARDETNTILVNRLIRVRHRVVVPTLGPVMATGIVGVPTAVSRTGGEIGLELCDKSLLADHGVRPHNYKKGSNVGDVLRHIMRSQTGERHLRIPVTKKKLSKAYKVGLGEDSLTPWAAFVKIAEKEAGWEAFYSADGFATCERPRTEHKAVKVKWILAVPSSSASFTDFINYVKITSLRKVRIKGKPGKKDNRKVTMRFSGVGQLPKKHDLSEETLNRNGVPRTLPLIIGDNSLKTPKAVDAETIDELRKGSKIDNEQALEIMPFFHLDRNDRLDLPRGIGKIPFNRASVPLGTGGNMTIGAKRWVSKPVTVKRVRSKSSVVRKKKKGGRKKNG